jgi:hypothetical protein
MASSEKRDGKTAKANWDISNRTMDAWENSEAAAALRRIQANPRIRYIVIAAPADACPECLQLVGTYPKDQVPQLPYETCSHPLGCRSFYLPFIEETYP